MTAVGGRAAEVKRGLKERVSDDRGAAGRDGCKAVSDALPIGRQVFQPLRSRADFQELLRTLEKRGKVPEG